MQTATENTQVAIINESIELFRSAPEILQNNQQRTQKALIVGNKILAEWQAAWQIPNQEERLQALAALDERSNKFLVNCSTALKEEKESRAAITQMMDEFKKLFTSAENEIDKAKANTIPSHVQVQRDTYAKEMHRIAEEKRIAAQKEADKQKELIEVKAKLEVAFSNGYGDYLLGKKQKLNAAFNALTLADFEDGVAIKFEAITFNYGYAFQVPAIPCYHITKEAFDTIVVEVVTTKEQEYVANYAAEMNLLHGELKDKLSSKYQELVEQKRLADEAAAEAERQRIETERRNAEIAAANEEERKRLEAEAEQARIENEKRNAELKAQQEAAERERKEREDAENARLAKEAEEAKKRAEQDAEIKTQGEQTMVMFNQEAAIAEIEAPAAKVGYDITVLHPVGFTQIFALWFENEGKNLGIDKIGNTKLDQMKAWAEKYAVKTGTKIDSKFVKYEESFKAVNKK
jgi:hypothetical protein